MGKNRRFNTKARTRHKKTGVARRQRMKVHRKRLIALGVKEPDVRHMTSKAMRTTIMSLVKKAATAKRLAKNKKA